MRGPWFAERYTGRESRTRPWFASTTRDPVSRARQRLGRRGRDPVPARQKWRRDPHRHSGCHHAPTIGADLRPDAIGGEAEAGAQGRASRSFAGSRPMLPAVNDSGSPSA